MSLAVEIETDWLDEEAGGRSVHSQLDGEMAHVVERVRGSLVRIVDGGGSGGSGVVLHPQGLILTSAHVLRRTRPQIALPTGEHVSGTVLAVERRLDLAALAIERDDLAALPLGDSRSLAPGNWVLAMGYPLSPGGAATAGTVIGVGWGLPEAPDGREWLTLDLHLRPGYSGGPVVDGQGRLVGLNAMMTGPSVGISVPVHVILPFLKEALSQLLD